MMNTFKKHKCPLISIPAVLAKVPSINSTEKLIFGLLYSRYSKVINSNNNCINKKLLAYLVHTTPENIPDYLFDLARNGWICLCTYGKKQVLININNRRCSNTASDKHHS